MPRRTRRQFVWIPPDRSTIWRCTIDDVDISDFIFVGKFPHGIISEELICQIDLNNAGEQFTNRFAARDEIVFKMDFSDGSTVQFKGEIEEIKSVIERGIFKYRIRGGHFTAQALDVTVTADFVDAQISDIRKELISTFLPDFTTNNVEDNTTTASFKFVNLPLLDCLLALDIEGDEDTYFDFDKDVHSFKRSGKNNDNEAVVWDDSLIELKGLGTDSAEVKNDITVYGDAGGLPVISTAKDSASQSTFRIKEKVITDNDIVDESQAQELADAENNLLKNPENLGSASTFFMPKLNPGDMVYVISPPHALHDRFRMVKFVFNVPNETMNVFFNKERTIPKLFKDRIKKDLGQDKIINPFTMTHSFNFTFDNENKIDTTSSSNVSVSDGNLLLDSGFESGTMVSIEKETPVIAKSIHLLVIGESLGDTEYAVRADSKAEFQVVTLDTEIQLDNPGTELQLRIKLVSSNTRIDAAALLYKA